MPHLPSWIPANAGRLRRRLGGLAALCLAVLALACSGGSRRDPAGALQVVNAGTRSMTSLYVTPSASSDWGPNQLGSQPMGAGGSLTLSPMPPEAYDVQAIFADGVVDTVNDVQVLDGATTVLYMANVGEVTVVNATGLWITDIYLVPSTAADWGTDQLSGTLLPGDSFNLTEVTAGSYDLRVVFLGGSYRDYLAFGVTPAATRTITVQ
jgi:hypothetical protein